MTPPSHPSGDLNTTPDCLLDPYTDIHHRLAFLTLKAHHFKAGGSGRTTRLLFPH